MLTPNCRFLLVYLHIDSLLTKKTKRKVLSALDALSTGSTALDDAYHEALDRIEDQPLDDSELAKTVLSWITYARRPLLAGELCHALAVEKGDTDLDPDNVPEVEDLISVCAGLVMIDEESNIIRLVHYTTQEYFERVREAWNPRAEQDIVSACLSYLSFDSFRSGICNNDSDFEDRLNRYQFLDYAARYWGSHMLAVTDTTILEQAVEWLLQSELMPAVGQIMAIGSYKYAGYSQRIFRNITGFHVTAYFNLTHLMELLLKRSDGSLNDVDYRGQTPLSWAAERGHKEVVKLLLGTSGIHVDPEEKSTQTPLSYAAMNGHEAVVKLLLATGKVDVNVENVLGWTPLSQAEERGHIATVKLLRQQGARMGKSSSLVASSN